ncbi:hypothetical protein HDU96_003921 [Phlyctochytrium bullatum]|nr:hypothetical protein HDU96_003921 [Phlyctochytrium bullatum]
MAPSLLSAYTGRTAGELEASSLPDPSEAETAADRNKDQLTSRNSMSAPDLARLSVFTHNGASRGTSNGPSSAQSVLAPTPSRPMIRPILKHTNSTSSNGSVTTPPLSTADAASWLSNTDWWSRESNDLPDDSTTSSPPRSASTTPTPTLSSSAPSSTPTTPRRSDSAKSLTFGQKLEHVCLFSSEDRPMEISKSPVYETPTGNILNGSGFLDHLLDERRARGLYPGDEDDSDDDAELEMPSRNGALYFTTPNTSVDRWTIITRTTGTSSAFASGSNVALDTIRMDDSGTTASTSKSFSLPTAAGKVLTGTILVRNLAFEKSVQVRLTCDDWVTHRDIVAPFAGTVSPSLPGFVGIDRFCFRVEVDQAVAWSSASAKAAAANGEVRMVMAVCCRMIGQEFWDNNHGINHSVLLTRGNGNSRAASYPSMFQKQPTAPSPVFPPYSSSFTSASPSGNFSGAARSSFYALPSSNPYFNGSGFLPSSASFPAYAQPTQTQRPRRPPALPIPAATSEAAAAAAAATAAAIAAEVAQMTKAFEHARSMSAPPAASSPQLKNAKLNGVAAAKVPEVDESEDVKTPTAPKKMDDCIAEAAANIVPSVEAGVRQLEKIEEPVPRPLSAPSLLTSVLASEKDVTAAEAPTAGLTSPQRFAGEALPVPTSGSVLPRRSFRLVQVNNTLAASMDAPSNLTSPTATSPPMAIPGRSGPLTGSAASTASYRPYAVTTLNPPPPEQQQVPNGAGHRNPLTMPLGSPVMDRMLPVGGTLNAPNGKTSTLPDLYFHDRASSTVVDGTSGHGRMNEVGRPKSPLGGYSSTFEMPFSSMSDHPVLMGPGGLVGAPSSSATTVSGGSILGQGHTAYGTAPRHGHGHFTTVSAPGMEGEAPATASTASVMQNAGAPGHHHPHHHQSSLAGPGSFSLRTGLGSAGAYRFGFFSGPDGYPANGPTSAPGGSSSNITTTSFNNFSPTRNSSTSSTSSVPSVGSVTSPLPGGSPVGSPIPVSAPLPRQRSSLAGYRPSVGSLLEFSRAATPSPPPPPLSPPMLSAMAANLGGGGGGGTGGFFAGMTALDTEFGKMGVGKLKGRDGLGNGEQTSLLR